MQDPDPTAYLRPLLTKHALSIYRAAHSGASRDALDLLGRHRLLCAHREGPWGVRTWNRPVEGWLTEETGDGLYEPMYVGRPLLVTANDYATGVFNGDTGVVVATKRADGTSGRVAVIRGSAGDQPFGTSRLGDVDTMHAMTVHKAQGSQADEVTVLLPPVESPLLTRELFYTAVRTRCAPPWAGGSSGPAVCDSGWPGTSAVEVGAQVVQKVVDLCHVIARAPGGSEDRFGDVGHRTPTRDRRKHLVEEVVDVLHGIPLLEEPGQSERRSSRSCVTHDCLPVIRGRPSQPVVACASSATPTASGSRR